jgi:Na+/citrate or Na+/malate symporter
VEQGIKKIFTEELTVQGFLELKIETLSNNNILGTDNKLFIKNFDNLIPPKSKRNVTVLDMRRSGKTLIF